MSHRHTSKMNTIQSYYVLDEIEGFQPEGNQEEDIELELFSNVMYLYAVILKCLNLLFLKMGGPWFG